jgi:hypothetical protein
MRSCRRGSSCTLRTRDRPSEPLEVGHLEVDEGVRLQNSLRAVSLGLELGQRQSRLTGIADLATVPSCQRVVVIVIRSKSYDIVDNNCSLLSFKALVDHIHVDLEHFDSLVFAQLWIVQADMDTRGEGLIKVADAISCQEQNAGVVLQDAKEHCYVLSNSEHKVEHAFGNCNGDSPATSPFRLKSSLFLCARKTSASSKRRIQSHLLAKVKLMSRAFSTSFAVDPRSPTLADHIVHVSICLKENSKEPCFTYHM